MTGAAAKDIVTTPQWTGVGLTDIGRVRLSNQDAFLVVNEVGLYVVADGMGGHAGGDRASRLAIDAFEEVWRSLPTGALSGTTAAHIEGFLRSTIAAAHRHILDEGARVPELRNMGTTLVSMHVSHSWPATACIAHVGDSRAYLYRDGALRQLTCDHSVVEDFVRRGLLSRAEAAVHPNRHALTRAVGIETTVEPDVTTITLELHDQLLLCTDGLTKMIADEELATWLRQPDKDPATTCRQLVEECNRRGGVDNITVVLCRAGSPS